MSDYYNLVPKGYVENLRFRREMVLWGCESPENAGQLWKMCARDVLFWVNFACWLFEPRDRSKYPFITYGFQDEALLEIVGAIGTEDLVIEKSRDMGASWMCVAAFTWFWQFQELSTFLVLSRTEKLVDRSGDPKSMFWKMRFLLDHQPKWMKPRSCEDLRMHLANGDNSSTVDGDSTNEFAGAADRRLAVLLDEFSLVDNDASIYTVTQHVTNSRIFNFTPKGSSNQAYRLATDPNKRRITLHWSRHPIKAQGLYRVPVDGSIELVDTDYWVDRLAKDRKISIKQARSLIESEGHKPIEYEFRLNRPKNPRFDFRSPWYDREESRATHPAEIAQELDIDYRASDSQYFDPRELQRLIEQTAQDPWRIGELDYVKETGRPGRFDDMSGGRLRLWMNLDASGRPPSDRDYACGADIGAGTGASPSVLCVADGRTGEQVAEFSSAHVRPDELADIAVSLCRWFKGQSGFGARLIWEAPGPGREFGDRVLELRFTNIYYRRQEKAISKKVSEIPGWWPTKDDRRSVYGEYKRAIYSGSYIVRSREQLEECNLIVFTVNGWVLHSRAKSTDEPSGAAENHGDRPTAGALCWKELKTSPEPRVLKSGPPRGSLAWRMREARREAAAKMEW